MIVLLIGCGQESVKSYSIVIDGSLLTEKLSKWETRNLRRNISISIDTVSARFGEIFRDTLYAYVFDEGLNEGGRNRIYLTRESSTDFFIIMHEVVHALGLGPPEASKFYLEGIAMLIPLVNMPAPQRYNYIHRSLQMNRDKLLSIEFLMENDSIFCKQHGAEIGIAYAEAGLFLYYLVNRYGWEQFQRLREGRIKDYQSVYGKTIGELEREWLETIFPTVPDDTLILN